MLIAAEKELPYLDLANIRGSEILLENLPEPLLLIMEKHSLLILTGHRIVLSCSLYALPDNTLKEIFFHLGEVCELYQSDKESITQKLAENWREKERNALRVVETVCAIASTNFDEMSIVSYAEKLLQRALYKKASDIHFDSSKQFLTIRFRIDGLLYDIEKLPIEFASRLMAHLKILAQLDTTEKRLPQDGRLKISVQAMAQFVDCRISTCPTLHDEKLVLRILNTRSQPLTLESLGLSDIHLKSFLALLKKPQGMILVTGPTGSGKTMTLYTALKILNQSVVNILTVEDPVEIELPGVNQVPINTKTGFTFASALRAFLRQDPDIIMVGEMRDKETADIAIKAAQTGHLVLSTLHTKSASETLIRLINMGIPQYDIAASLSLIISQRLVRKLCEHCKARDLLSEYYIAVGCEHCQNGYQGRVGIFEFLMITPMLASYLLQQQYPNALELQQKAIQAGMMTLSQSGLEKVKAGVTTLSELSRVM